MTSKSIHKVCLSSFISILFASSILVQASSDANPLPSSSQQMLDFRNRGKPREKQLEQQIGQQLEHSNQLDTHTNNPNAYSIISSKQLQVNNVMTNTDNTDTMTDPPMIDSTITSFQKSNEGDSSSTMSTTESNQKQIGKAAIVEKLRLKRKRIQDDRRAKLKEHRSKFTSSNTTSSSSFFFSEKRPKAELRGIKPTQNTLNAMSREDVDRAFSNNRKLWSGWNGNSGVSVNPYDVSTLGLADPGEEYDEWQQAYRTVGAFVDCDHDWDNSGSGDNGDRGCSRWMMWAAYVDPNYQGGGYDEYHYDLDDGYDPEYDDTHYGKLDCHLDDTEWLLLGVYRQEFYQYLEQISKHLWGADEWEYIVALATLEYIGDDECEAVGYDNNAAVLYTAIQPLPLGYFQMGLYNDENCLYPLDLDELGYTYDDFWAGDRRLEDGGDDDYYWWKSAQEYTLADANEVYDTFKYCTLCLDYPTYQDGELNGDSGYDDDDLINQCWKFYSHDSFTCGAECIRSGHAQGGLTNLKYGQNYFGTGFTDSYYTSSSSSATVRASGTDEETSKFIFSREKMDRLKANVFVTFSGILFVATLLAFSVARSTRELPKSSLVARNRRRKSRGRESRKDPRSAELLENSDREDTRERDQRRRRSKGRTKSNSEYRPPDSSKKPKSSRKPDPYTSERKSRSRSRSNPVEQNYRTDDF